MLELHDIQWDSKVWVTGGPRYMRSVFLWFRVHAIEILVFQRSLTSNSPKLLVSCYANLLYANLFVFSYNGGNLCSNRKTGAIKATTTILLWSCARATTSLPPTANRRVL